MQRFSALVASLALSAGAAAQSYQPWSGARLDDARFWSVPAEEIYPEGPPDFAHRLPLTLVILDKTNWTEARALRHVRKTAVIFAACKIELGPITLARGRGPDGMHDIDMNALAEGSNIPLDVVDLAARAPASAPWPRVFFVGRLEGDDALARAYRRGAVDDKNLPQFPYMNSAWVSYQAHWRERSEKGYSSLAHELAHVLCECGHTDGETRHLLHGKRNFLGTKILDSDCAKMTSSSLLSLSPR